MSMVSVLNIILFLFSLGLLLPIGHFNTIAPSKYTKEEQEFCTQCAKEFGLLESGGSDFHGENKPDIKIGLGQGDLQVPYEFLSKMKNNL